MSHHSLAGAVLGAVLVLNALSIIGLLLYGLFVFTLSDTAPALSSPLLSAVDVASQLFLNVLQAVMGSMLWKLRSHAANAQILSGVQRAAVVVSLLQLLVFLLFGLASDFVVFAALYVLAFTILAFNGTSLLRRIWNVDLLRDRLMALQCASLLNVAAWLMAATFATLKINQGVDSWIIGSDAFSEVVMGHVFVTAAAIVEIPLLLYILWLWLSSNVGENLANPVQSDVLDKIRHWNVWAAALGLFGPPVVFLCLTSNAIINATLHVPLKTGPNDDLAEERDIFYDSKGRDRFSMEF